MVAFSFFCFAPLLLKNEDRSVSRIASLPFLKPVQTTFGRPRSWLASAATADIERLPAIRDGVTEAGGEEEWKKAVSRLTSVMEVDQDEAEVLIADATNWKGWAMCSSDLMRKYIKCQIPDADKLEEALNWLKDGPLELDQQQLCAAIRQLPKVYLTDPENSYKLALKAAPEEFKNPEIYRTLVLEDPLALQCTYNCSEDGCNSECGNCWVSFQNS